MKHEDQNTEFKRDYTDSVVKTAIAFSNTNGGKILLGIDDDGNVVGLEDSDDVCKRCVQDLRDKVRPDITATSNVEIETVSGKRTVNVTVLEGSNKPYYLRERGLRPESVYIRNGTASVPVTEDHFINMMNRQRSIEYESMISFKQNLSFEYAERIFEKKKLIFDKEHMETLGMIAGGQYTNLAFILSDQFDQGIKMAVFSEEYKTEFIDRGATSGSVLKQIEECVEFIMKFNRLGAKIVGIERIDNYAFPLDVIREAILNAIAHRDYSVCASTLVSIFPDKMTIVSPGGLHTLYSIDDLFKGVSSTRNRKLADVLYRLEYIESYGTGLPRIKHAYDIAKLTPVIEYSMATFRITLPSMDSKPITKVDSFISENDEFTRSIMEEKLGMKRFEAIATINYLIEQGKITVKGSGRSTRYVTVRK